MNIFTFTGRLGQDAEQRFTPSGMAILSFSVAIDTGYGDNKSTLWARCAIFGKRAEGKLVDYLKKGQQVAGSGEAKLNEFQGKDGQTKTTFEVSIDKIDLIGGGSSNAPQQSAHQQAKQDGYMPPAAPVPEPEGGFDDDIPF